MQEFQNLERKRGGGQVIYRNYTICLAYSAYSNLCNVTRGDNSNTYVLILFLWPKHMYSLLFLSLIISMHFL